MISDTPSKGTRDDDDDSVADVGFDAISLLEADHLQVEQMFADYELLVADDASDEERAAVVYQICNALTAHTTAEEEIFYPAARDAIGDDELIDEALDEHAGAKELIEQLNEMAPSDETYDAKVRMLQEVIDAHVLEEEGELFPRVREAALDLERLGEQIAQRKEEVLAALEADES